MKPVRKIAVVVGTFAVAAGVGFLMQNGDAIAARFSNETPAPTVTSNIVRTVTPRPAPTVIVAVGSGEAVPVVAPSDAPQVTPPTIEARPTVLSGGGADVSTLAPKPQPLGRPAAADDVPVILAAAEGAPAIGPEVEAGPLLAEPQPIESCEITMDARPAPVAMVDVALEAPCHPSTRFTVHHQGLMVTMTTDEAGRARFSVPALDTRAVVLAAFPDGDGAMSTVDVPELARVDRAVLMWQGETGLGIHALEYGAGFDDEGHVWSGHGRAPEVAMADGKGFLMRLGDPSADAPLLAEVYTFPSGLARTDGTVEISVEAEVTPQNCGRDVKAQSIQLSPGHSPNALDLVLAMPECDAVGDLLVLQNMFADLTLAAE